ncbi:hypothetical protein Tco_0903000 [Tanacetum coccineum]
MMPFTNITLMKAQTIEDMDRNNSSGGDVVDLTGDNEDRDTEMGDSTGVSVSLSGGISSEGKKSQELNIGGSDNRGKTAGRAIIAWGDGIASYACITFIYGSLIASEGKRYLVKLSKESGEVFPYLLPLMVIEEEVEVGGDVERLGTELERLGATREMWLDLWPSNGREDLVSCLEVKELWTVPLEMSPGSTFIASRFLTYPSAPLVVVICGTPTVTGQMANSVALVAFGRS